MSEATTPANPTDQIAAVAPDAQQYDWRSVVDAARNLILGGLVDDLAAYIERLEAERDALLAEHEAVGEGYGDETADAGCDCLSCRIIRAHDNAERVIRAANS